MLNKIPTVVLPHSIRWLQATSRRLNGIAYRIRLFFAQKHTVVFRSAIVGASLFYGQYTTAELAPAQLNTDFVLNTIGQTESLGDGDQLNGNLTFDANDSVFSIGDDSTVTGDISVSAGVTGAELILNGSGSLESTLGDALGTLQLNAQTSQASIHLLNDINASSVIAGSNGNKTELYIDNALDFSGDLVLFNADTKLHISDKQVEVGGLLDISGASITATINTDAADNFQINTAAGSGFIHSNRLIMSQTQGERFSFDYQNVPKHDSRYLFVAADTIVDSGLITYTQYAQNETGERVEDNSYLIDSAVIEDDEGLVLVVSRPGGLNTDNAYIVKSDTAGNFSNPAAWTLGNIAAEGTQSGDLAYVIDMLERDENQLVSDSASLKEQVNLLAPVANMAAFRSIDNHLMQTAQTVYDRLQLDWLGVVEEGDRDDDLWVSMDALAFAQSGVGDYNGFTAQTAILQMGVDHRAAERARLGVSLYLGNARTQQQDFRDGDKGEILSAGFLFYSSYEIRNWFLNGSVQIDRSKSLSTRQTAVYRVAKSRSDWESGSVTAGISYRHRLLDGRSSLVPSLSLRSSRFNRGEFTETGAGDLSLKYDELDVRPSSIRAQLAFQTNGTFLQKPANSAFKLGIKNTKNDSDFAITTHYNDIENTAFNTDTVAVDALSIELGADTVFELSKYWQMSLGLGLEHRTREQKLAATVELRWN